MTAENETGNAEDGGRRIRKSDAAFRTISEVSTELNVPQHVLRFWETRFDAVQPMKRGGGRRYYRPEDVVLLRAIRDHLYGDGFTIKGVQKLIAEQGLHGFLAARVEAAAPAVVATEPEPAPVAEAREPGLPFDIPSAGAEPRAAAAKPAAPSAYRAEIEAAVHSLESLKAVLDQALFPKTGSHAEP